MSRPELNEQIAKAAFDDFLLKDGSVRGYCKDIPVVLRFGVGFWELESGVVSVMNYGIVLVRTVSGFYELKLHKWCQRLLVTTKPKPSTLGCMRFALWSRLDSITPSPRPPSSGKLEQFKNKTSKRVQPGAEGKISA